MKTALPLIIIASFLGFAKVCSAREIVDDWRYTLRHPADNWRQADFDDSGWTEGSGGFGTRSTPGARVGTVWATNDIWLRKTFTLQSVPDRAAILIHHDEDAEVYINGQSVAVLKGFTQEYKVVPIDAENRGRTAARPERHGRTLPPDQGRPVY